MKHWIRAASLSASIDLTALSGLLYQRGIQHRITEESGHQVIWVEQAALIEPLNDLLHKIQSGELVITPQSASGHSWLSLARGRDAVHYCMGKPVTTVLVILSLLGALVVEWESQLSISRWLMFQHVFPTSDGWAVVPLEFSLAKGQLWRLFTPIFLHFSLFHILFNSLWLWEFGRRIESVTGHWRFLNLVLLVALISNASQFLWQQHALFGGMSGVIYGLVGYIWIRHRLAPIAEFAIPPGIIGFMLVWLVVCMVGTLDWLAQIKIANAAHFSGLVVGVICGAIAGLKNRTPR